MSERERERGRKCVERGERGDMSNCQIVAKNIEETTPTLSPKSFFFSIRPPSGLLPLLGPPEVVHDSYT